MNPSHVVGIGASAGGLEALERFFSHVPGDTGMAFVVVQHLSPDFKSLMNELLARRTDLPIHLVTDAMPVEANHVYLIPPKKEMIISGDRLLLSERDPQQELKLPIDVFFRSLAQECGPRAVAIVLSGGGSDGSRGVRDVHDAGGLVLVQDEVSAQFDGMPRTARDAGVADAVLAPEDMPRLLVEHKSAQQAGVAGRATVVGAGLPTIYKMLEEEFGIDFTHYKPSTVTRRIERRLQLARAGDVEDYVARLASGREDLDILYRDLLIGVTRFFRNEKAFELLEQQVLPDMLRRGSPDEPFRVWVAGCATGEEVYSLAIVLQELTAGTRPIKIFATDVHKGSLEIAARGVYDEVAVRGVPPERLQRWFVQRGTSYQVVPELRQTIVFAPHNVMRDAPFTRVDLVSCRNLLIYLQPPAQQKVLSLFHFALNRGGVVFLGPSESPGALSHDFETVHAHWRVYRKHSDVRMPVDPRVRVPRMVATSLPMGGGLSRAAGYSPTQLVATYDALLDEFMPPSLLVDERGELVHVFAGASKFLRAYEGRQKLDVLEAVDPELKMVLVGGLQRARKEQGKVVYHGVRARSDDDQPYKVTIRPLAARGAPLGRQLLVTFEEIVGVKQPEAAPESAHQVDLDRISQERASALETELAYTKENLQAAIEELETSNEELQAANEELLASNEELQSTNEELQSVNEELYTVNAEYQRKIGELTELTNDMDNLLSNTDVGVIFLDADLRIRKFTPRTADIFALMPQDVGRPLKTFTYKMHHPGLGDDLQHVLTHGQPVERELADKQGRSYFLRVLPYRAKGRIDGVVLTLIDVTGLKTAEDALFHERYLLGSLLLSVPDAIYFKDARGRLIRVNPAMAARLGLATPADAPGKTPFEVPRTQEALAMHQKDDPVLRTGDAQLYAMEKRERGDGFEEWDLVSRLPLRDKDGHIVGIIGIYRDVTEERRSHERIEEAVRRRDQFLAMLSHELRNPLGAVVTATSLLQAGRKDEPTDDAGRQLRERREAQTLEIIVRQSRQMSHLLDDLLDASRVTQNKIELHRKVLDVREVVDEALGAVRNVIDRRKLELTTEIDTRPLYVDGDSARLQQVVVNLLSNAAKYTAIGGHVWLTVRREGPEMVVCVRDDGAGIPPDMLPNIFDLFVQSSRTLDRSDGGLGVGLTLVRALVGMHGGTVSAFSAGEGKGTEIVVRLPAAAPNIREEPVRLRHSLRLRRGARVVVVEDNADGRQMLCELLEMAGFDCHTANDGLEGLAMVQEVKPAVAIVDVGLPGIDGFEFAERVRGDARLSGTYLVALTGYGQPQDRARALHAGFDEHMVKPVDPGKLLRLLSGSDADGAGKRDGADGVVLPS